MAILPRWGAWEALIFLGFFVLKGNDQADAFCRSR